MSRAVRILSELRGITGERPYLLASQHSEKKPDQPYSERALSRAVRENEEHWEILHFTPHDLRRTAASMMTSIGIPRLHVEKVLNHRSMTGTTTSRKRRLPSIDGLNN